MKNSRSENEKNRKLRRAMDEGADIAGGAIGGALGVISGDPALAAVLGATGAAAGSTLRHVGSEIVDRMLGPRERKRVGAAMAIIARDIHIRTKRGDRIRSDDFFDRTTSGRCDAEEVAESVILKCQREPEEKKIQYMGHFYSSVAFRPEVGAHMAHQLIKHAEQMTYRQFCIMNIAKSNRYRSLLRQTDYRGQKTYPVPLQELLYELLDLYNRGFVNFGGEVAFGPTDVKPGSMEAQGLGVHLATLLSVELIPEEDLLPIVEQLR